MANQLNFNTFIVDKVISRVVPDECNIEVYFFDTGAREILNDITIRELANIIMDYCECDNKLLLSANADCCSESWFEFGDQGIHTIIGKEITNITKVGSVDLPQSHRQECDNNYSYIINFKDDSTFMFYLRNSSNGYYDGWLEQHITPYTFINA